MSNARKLNGAGVDAGNGYACFWCVAEMKLGKKQGAFKAITQSVFTETDALTGVMIAVPLPACLDHVQVGEARRLIGG